MQEFLGGQPASLRGQLDGLLFNDVWMLASKHAEGTPAPTEGRAIDHIAFVVSDLDLVAEDMRKGGVNFTQNPMIPEAARIGQMAVTLRFLMDGGCSLVHQ